MNDLSNFSKNERADKYAEAEHQTMFHRMGAVKRAVENARENLLFLSVTSISLTVFRRDLECTDLSFAMQRRIAERERRP